MIAIIDYDAGNVRSLQFALQRLGAKSILTNDPKVIKAAEKVIFPGQGAAGSAMRKLKGTGLDKLIPILNQPVLGICLGMQVKVPQMGWNNIYKLQLPLFKGITEGDFMYLVHSFYVPVIKETIAQSDYREPYSVALKKNNFYGVQFHPEKSSKSGSQLLKNFLAL